MKILNASFCALALMSFFAMPNAIAKPTQSKTSAQAAAKLKNHPPKGWIRHYLGDDRYKIAGNIWKVVSTQTDDYSHRADCPRMLRQSADIVIGFPSLAAAVEAGYLPDPHCRPDINRAAIKAKAAAIAKARQVRLADGRSTVTIPAGWQRNKTQKIGNAMLRATVDSFTSASNSRDGVAIITIDFPQGASAPLTAAKARGYMSMYRNSGYVNSAIPQASEQMNVRDVTFKGMQGVLMTPKTKANDALFYMVQKGSRMYVVAAGGHKGISSGAKKIIDSYRPR